MQKYHSDKNINFNTPVLFLVFNRPECTQKVFNVIKAIRPKYLFVAADGPRTEVEKDLEKCSAVRDIIIKQVNWDCQLKTLFRKDNIGCGKSVSSAIGWFFENVEQGIILEDDCLPNLSFFTFCEELLEKYKQERKVSIISGFNFQNRRPENEVYGSYFFSDYAGIWGWASWRRAWEGYDFDMSSWTKRSSRRKLRNKFSWYQMLCLKEGFDAVYYHKVDTWDFQWWYHRLVNETVGIVPVVNLIQNIGFNEDATHTLELTDKIDVMNSYSLSYPLVYPKDIVIDHLYEKWIFDRYYRRNVIWIAKDIIKRIIYKTKLMLKLYKRN